MVLPFKSKVKQNVNSTRDTSPKAREIENPADTRLTSLNNESVAGASEAKANINDLVVGTSETSHNIDAYSRNVSKQSCSK